jgi:exopolysaccharide biosynthesis polyprenyl glycosylphosphotransferase
LSELGERSGGGATERGEVRRSERGRHDVATRRVLAAGDLAALLAAMAVSQLVITPQANALQSFLLGLLTLPAWIVLFNLYGLYDRDAKRISCSTVDDFPRLFHSLVIGSLGLWAYSKLVFPHRLELIQGVSFFALSLLGILAGRAAGRALMASRIRRERALLVGRGPIAELIQRKIECHPEYGLDLIGRVGPSTEDLEGIDGRPGDTAWLERAVALEGVDRVVVVSTGMDEESVLELLRQSSDLEIKISLVPNLVEAIGSAVEVDDLEGVTVLGINPPILARSSRFMKRSMDVAIALTVLVLALPVMLVAALAIKLTSPGPILFMQERVGRRGRRFRIYKFRTMCEDAQDRAAELRELSGHSAWLVLEDDPRITRVGRILRQTSIDELPQLLNVLQGDMSLVGPRPMPPEVDKLIDGWSRRRLHLTPGITGLWQVLGRTSIPFEEMVNLDYLYVTNWSLWQDIRLLIRTLPAVTARRGAN